MAAPKNVVKIFATVRVRGRPKGSRHPESIMGVLAFLFWHRETLLKLAMRAVAVATKQCALDKSCDLFKFVTVLLSASVKRVGVYRMRDFFTKCCN